MISLSLFGYTNKKLLPEIYLSIILRNRIHVSLVSFLRYVLLKDAQQSNYSFHLFQEFVFY